MVPVENMLASQLIMEEETYVKGQAFTVPMITILLNAATILSASKRFYKLFSGGRLITLAGRQLQVPFREKMNRVRC